MKQTGATFFESRSVQDPLERVRLWLPDRPAVAFFVDQIAEETGATPDEIEAYASSSVAPWAVPVWWLDVESCDVHGEECPCRPVRLPDLVEVLSPEDLVDAVNAHVDVLGELREHLFAAMTARPPVDADGNPAPVPDGGPRAPVCAACITDPAHNEFLVEALLDRSLQLMDTLLDTGLRFGSLE